MLNNQRSGAFHILNNRPMKALFQIAVIFLAVVLFISFLGASDYHIEGISFKVYIKPSFDGRSYLKLPPLGNLSADTHQGPVDFFVELTEVHPEVIEKVLSLTTTQTEWISEIRSEVKKHLVLFLLKQALLGAAGAALLHFILFRPQWKKVLFVFLTGFALTASLLIFSAATFNIEAFKQPKYTGAIAAGPEVLQLADNLYEKFLNFKDKTDEVVSSVNTLFSALDGLEAAHDPESEEVQVLVVSDISNNPVGIELAETLADSFNVDMVIDAGDLTDFGSPLEAQAFKQIGDLGVPYLFAPGNHDSPEVLAFLRSLPNVSILEGNLVKTNGLAVLGVADPWASTAAVNGDSDNEIQRALEEQAAVLKAKLEENKDVDIAVIHNPSKVKSLEGLAPIIISGHTHRLSVKRSGGSLLLNPGTTGASGFRGFQAEEMNYSALILHLVKDTEAKMVVDIIEYDPLSSSITTQRRLL